MSIQNLPPGFRFHPTDEELIIHYLKKKVSSPTSSLISFIAGIDLYKFNPWELPGKSIFGDNEWFFFTPRDRKYPNGVRPNRSAGSGYWKATGTDKPILSSGGLQCLGVKKALVFYQGRPPKGRKTDWAMHEYRLVEDARSFPRLRGSMRLDEWVLCRVRQKNIIPGDNQEDSNNFGCVPSNTSSNFSNKELNANTYFPRDCIDNQYQIHQHSPQGSAAVDDNQAHNFFSIEQGTYRPQVVVSAYFNQSHSAVASHVIDGRESHKRAISDGSSVEEITFPPNKRLHATSSDDIEDTSAFEIPDLANWSSIPQCFSGLIF